MGILWSVEEVSARVATSAFGSPVSCRDNDLPWPRLTLCILLVSLYSVQNRHALMTQVSISIIPLHSFLVGKPKMYSSPPWQRTNVCSEWLSSQPKWTTLIRRHMVELVRRKSYVVEPGWEIGRSKEAEVAFDRLWSDGSPSKSIKLFAP